MGKKFGINGTSTFKRYTLDLEESEKTNNVNKGNININSFSLESKQKDVGHTHLLYKGSQRVKGIIHNNPNTCVSDDIRDMLDSAI